MSLIYKWLFRKTVGEVKIAGGEDPYRETIPNDELGRFQREGAKRKKALPPGLSKNDAKVLTSVRRRAYQLDLAFECCCGLQVGWAGLIGILPWIGDCISAYLALCLVRKAREIDGGLPKYIEAQMIGNTTFDFVIGLIPIVGDVINIAYKANSRNCVLLEVYLKKKSGTNQHRPNPALDDGPSNTERKDFTRGKPVPLDV